RILPGCAEDMDMPNILVVDDCLEAARPLAMLLRLFKHQVDCAASGDEALAHMEEQLPDVVVLDVMMPGMDGLEVLRRIRSDPRTRVVSVVMFSAVSDPAYQEAALKKGADDYIIKGIEFEQLRSRIEHWVARRHATPSGPADSSTTNHSHRNYH